VSSAKEEQMNVTMRDVLVHQARQHLFAGVLTRHKAGKEINFKKSKFFSYVWF
jgi:hypothetical protein